MGNKSSAPAKKHNYYDCENVDPPKKSPSTTPRREAEKNDDSLKPGAGLGGNTNIFSPPPLPTLLGFPTSFPDDKKIFCGETGQDDKALFKAIADALPIQYQEKWKLRYSSSLHGKSFTRLVDRSRDQGPTVVIIKEAVTTVEGQQQDTASSGKRTAQSPRVFGGFVTSPWTTVSDRDREGKSLAAARARAERNGIEAPEERPKNQAAQFFGSNKCFLFTSGTSTDPNSPQIYQSKSNINSNYQYLFDKHPDEDRIGMGMGGKPNFHAWFLDRWLEKGHCRGTICTTFGNPALCPREQFLIDSVEIYSVDPETWAEEGDETTDDGNPKRMGLKGTVLENKANVNVDMMLLELNGNHQFRADQVVGDEEEDEEHNPSGQKRDLGGKGTMACTAPGEA